jgi:predicted ATPase
MHGDTSFIESIRLENLLSYGSPAEPIELKALNVLIGPNASGKSNLIEALALLRAAPRDLMETIRAGGGVGEWLWKGGDNSNPTATIETVVRHPDGPPSLQYRLRFTTAGHRLEIVEESIRAGEDPIYRCENGWPQLQVRMPGGAPDNRNAQPLEIADFRPDESVFSQFRSPDLYPELTYLGDRFESIRLYREWSFSRSAPVRMPQKTDLPSDFLLENAGNLGLVLNDLEHRAGVKPQIVTKLREFYPPVEAVTTGIQGGTLQIFLHEKGLSEPIPATRVSDGLLQYLCLLAILCHPSPPPLICIKEPELGLHPDVLHSIAELLVEASHRTQVLITTHSDLLVSALSDYLESVLVCERDGGEGTRLRRLDKDALRDWLKKYQLGELWLMGEIGGTKW